MLLGKYTGIDSLKFAMHYLSKCRQLLQKSQ